MKLNFTGTGAAFYPRLGSNCAFFVRGKHLYMIDCGESTFKRMEARREMYDCPEITILLTHLHADHIGSLGSFLAYCAIVLGKRVRLFSADDTVVGILRATGVPEDLYDFSTDFTRAGDESLRIEPIPVRHEQGMACLAFLLTDEEGTICFSGDTNGLPPSVYADFLSGRIRRLYHECTQLKPHGSAHTALSTLCEAIPPEHRGRVCCMHLGGPYEEEIRAAGFDVAQLAAGREETE